jgi:hypothetical protein
MQSSKLRHGFLGLGAQPPAAEWGTMLADAQFIRSDPWLVTLPGLAILITVVSINLAGDGLRDALDRRWAVVSANLTQLCAARRAVPGGLLLWRSALHRPRCAARLRARRETRFAHSVRCAQTVAAS